MIKAAINHMACLSLTDHQPLKQPSWQQLDLTGAAVGPGDGWSAVRGGDRCGDLMSPLLTSPGRKTSPSVGM